MSEWWTYRPSSFLLFSARVYYRLLELHNLEVWPIQILMALLGLAIVYLILTSGRLPDRLVPVSLGAIWIWVAWSFLWNRYATINWAAAYAAPGFAVEGLLLMWIGTASGGRTFAADRKLSYWLGVGILVLALVGYPLIAPAVGRPWSAAEMFGIMPDPTAVATLAVLAIYCGRAQWLLMIIPLLWCMITGATLWTMGAADFLAAPIMGLAALGLALIRHQTVSSDERCPSK